MISVENLNYQGAIRPSSSGFCSLRFQNREYDNLEILYYPYAPNTSILCSTGKMVAVSRDSINEVLTELIPPQVFMPFPSICLIQYYSLKEKVQLPFLFRFAIQDPERCHNHGLITSSQVYCSIHHKLLDRKSTSDHLKAFHKDLSGELDVPPFFSKTSQLSHLLFWQIRHQISHNALHSPILRHGLWEIPSSDTWDTYYDTAAECTKLVINREIEIAEHISIFIDGWTSNHRYEGIRISFCHYGTLINRFLSLMFLDGELHTAENLVAAIRELDQEYHFLHKTIWLVSDCANVNKKVAKILKLNFVPCGVHRYMICFEIFNDNCWLQTIIAWLSSLSKSSILHDQIFINRENPFSSLLSLSNTR